jgi:hemerythrin
MQSNVSTGSTGNANVPVTEELTDEQGQARADAAQHYGAEDHVAINEQLLAQVAEHADAKTVATIFNKVGAALRQHLAEEERAFPAFEKEHPWEIRRLREDHEAFRRTLDALLVLAELRLLPAQTVHAFIARLREHAKREDASLYAWTDDKAASSSRHPLIDGLLDYLRGRLTRRAG